MNTVEIKGNIGKDATMKKFESGNVVIEFSVATSKIVDNNGSQFTKTQWHYCKLFTEKVSEAQLKKLKKGAQVHVTGSLEYNSYDKEVGKETIKMKAAYINVETVKPTDK